MATHGWLERATAADPERVAVETTAGSVVYRELLERARGAAGALVGLGVRAGDRVAIALPAGLEFAVAFHGCLLVGAVAQPIDLRLAGAERERRAEGAAAVVESPLAGGSPLDGSAVRDPDAVAVLLHTSGTTGAPRAIGLTYGNFERSAAGSAEVLGLDPAERWLCALPLAHVGGMSILVRSAIYGTTAVVHERFDAAAATRALMREGVTLASLVPTTLARMLDAGLERPPALRCALTGGAPLPAPLARRALEAGVPVAQTYGMTEACSQVATSAPGEPETAGRPLPGTRVEIGADGEILVSGPTVAPGAAGPDGRLHTGDLGRLDERGRLTVTGRLSELIVTGGENVAPAEVEAVLLAHAAVADAAVFGAPDPEWGEAVTALVVPRDGAPVDPVALRAHCSAALAGYKVPKSFVAVATVPRTPSGKILRGALAAAPTATA